jgi:hypothetical protein
MDTKKVLFLTKVSGSNRYFKYVLISNNSLTIGTLVSRGWRLTSSSKLVLSKLEHSFSDFFSFSKHLQTSSVT